MRRSCRIVWLSLFIIVLLLCTLLTVGDATGCWPTHVLTAALIQMITLTEASRKDGEVLEIRGCLKGTVYLCFIQKELVSVVGDQAFLGYFLVQEQY